VYHSTLGLRVIKKKKNSKSGPLNLSLFVQAKSLGGAGWAGPPLSASLGGLGGGVMLGDFKVRI